MHDHDQDTRPPSRSQKKREATELQQLGERLVALRPDVLRKAEMPGDLVDEVLFYKTLTKHEAKRRQMQLIGKLMREADVSAIRELVEGIDEAHTIGTRAFHAVEHLRDRLVEGDDAAVDEVFEQYPDVDGQHFRQLVRNARLEKSKGKPPKASRALFRMLRELAE
ncbi:ribosome biogenesis factor YjgA [Salidesulfovibrio brasiliensis]